MITRRLLLAGSAAASLGSLAPALAASSRELRVVCGFPAGGTADTVARRAAEGLAPSLAPTVIVENKTGASGQIAALAVKTAPADGSMLLLTPLGLVSTLPHSFAHLQFDAQKDFLSVSAGASFDYAIGVGPMVPASVKTITDLMQWCKLNPDRANFGSPAAGTAPHFIGLLLGRQAGAPLTHAPYRGTPPALLDMVGGHIPMVIGPLGEFLQFAKEGKCRLLGICGERRSRFAPDVPTLQEQGYQNLVVSEWFGFFARSGTSASIVERTNLRIGEVLNTRGIAENFALQGLEVKTSTPAAMSDRVNREYAMWRDVVKTLNFTPLS